jgi:hypothetical protein
MDSTPRKACISGDNPLPNLAERLDEPLLALPLSLLQAMKMHRTKLDIEDLWVKLA